MPRFVVRPRWTPGSPGTVDEALALRVAAQELRAHERHLSGRYGEVAALRAREQGVAGIVERRVERRKHWDVTDMITGESFARAFGGGP